MKINKEIGRVIDPLNELSIYPLDYRISILQRKMEEVLCSLQRLEKMIAEQRRER